MALRPWTDEQWRAGLIRCIVAGDSWRVPPGSGVGSWEPWQGEYVDWLHTLTRSELHAELCARLNADAEVWYAALDDIMRA